MPSLGKSIAGAWLKINVVYSVYASVGVSVGGLTAIVMSLLDSKLNAWACFGFGFFLPIGPLYPVFSSVRVVRWRLEQYRKLKDDSLITADQYKELRKTVMDWYGSTAFPRREGD